MWLLAVDDDALWEYRYPHRTKAGFSYMTVLLDKAQSWTDNDDDEEGSSIIGAKLAGCLWIFSMAVKNNWFPAVGEERERLIHDMTRLGARAEEDHVWVSEVNMVLQEQKNLECLQYDIKGPSLWQLCLLCFSASTSLSENIRKDGRTRNRMERTSGHALRAAIERTILTRWTEIAFFRQFVDALFR